MIMGCGAGIWRCARIKSIFWWRKATSFFMIAASWTWATFARPIFRAWSSETSSATRPLLPPHAVP